MTWRRFATIVLVPVLLPAGACVQRRPASEPAAASQPVSKPAIYDTAADARQQIRAAQAISQRENQRVLLMFGGNWCGWCQKLHALFKNDKNIAKTLLYEYQLVMVDIGRFDKQMDIPTGYEIDLKKAGVPFLVVLDADGKVLARQETGSLEKEGGHDPKKVADFLAQWKATPRDAEKTVADAKSRAAAAGKSIFLHLGAPWCPWCRKLDGFLSRTDIAEALAVDWIDVKIDVDRMEHAAEVVKRYRTDEKGGIPWCAVLDGQGRVLATSDAPNGNIGYPAEPAEIDWFMGMLRKTAHKASAEQLDRIAAALKEAAAKMKTTSRGGG